MEPCMLHPPEPYPDTNNKTLGDWVAGALTLGATYYYRFEHARTEREIKLKKEIDTFEKCVELQKKTFERTTHLQRLDADRKTSWKWFR